MTATDIMTNAAQPNMLDSRLLVLFPKIFVSFESFIIIKRRGTDTVPFMTAAYTSALMGSMLAKFIKKPVIVAAEITR
jgi:hypothetical protein